MRPLASRPLGALFALAVGLLACGAAQAQTWTFTRVRTLIGTEDLSVLDLSLGWHGEVAWRAGSTSQAVQLVRPQTGVADLVALAGSASTTFSIARLRQISEPGQLLLGMSFHPADGRGRGIFTWDRKYGLIEIHSRLSSSGTAVDLQPDFDGLSRILFFETNGASSTLYRREGPGVVPWLASCSGMTRAVTSFGGYIAFDCGPTNASTIWGGLPESLAILADGALHGTPGQGGHVPYGISDGVEHVHLRSFVAPTGWFWRSPGGLLPLADTTFCSDVEVNVGGEVLCVSGTFLYVADLPASQAVVTPSTVLDGATPVALSPNASLNDLGQVAFAAQLSNGTKAIYLATPSDCDSDLDGHCDLYDNCPGYADSSQLDLDEDGRGNRCDNCPFHANADQADANADGRGDACAPCSGSGFPRCGVRAKPAGTDVFTVTGVDLTLFPARPGLGLLVKSLTPGVSVDVSMVGNGCNPPPSGFTIPIHELFDGDGIDARDLYDSYPTFSWRNGVLCDVQFRATGPAGSYEWLVDARTVPPIAGNGSATTVAPAPITQPVATPNSVDFIDEAHNFRFLDDGTGGANFGNCTFQPDPPVSFGNQVVYSGGTGPGWDCCTFQFDGVDDLESNVGQIVYDVNGAPPPPDDDLDAFLAPCDNCVHLPNDQLDGGRVNSATPDQIGDACQCGRLAADGIVNADDVSALRNHLRRSALLGTEQLARCSVIGGPNECTIRTVTVLRRALAVPPLAPGVSQVCDAAVP